MWRGAGRRGGPARRGEEMLKQTVTHAVPLAAVFFDDAGIGKDEAGVATHGAAAGMAVQEAVRKLAP